MARFMIARHLLYANIVLSAAVLYQIESPIMAKCSEQIIVGRPLSDYPSDAETSNRILTMDEFGNLKLEDVKRDSTREGREYSEGENETEQEQQRQQLHAPIGQHSLADIMANKSANYESEDIRLGRDGESYSSSPFRRRDDEDEDGDDNGRDRDDSVALSEPKIEGKWSLSSTSCI